MKLAEMRHSDRNMGANQWWDAVTGADEYGDMVTTFMHKRWGTALQLFHDSRHTYLPFRFIPHLSWITGSAEHGRRPEALMFYAAGEVEPVDYWFASRHLEELNFAREADSALPDSMEVGGWHGYVCVRASCPAPTLDTHTHSLSLSSLPFPLSSLLSPLSLCLSLSLALPRPPSKHSGAQ